MPRSDLSPVPLSADTITAPAPSPKSTQVDLSSQSINFENVSEPITNTFFAWPEIISALAFASAKTKPAHTA